LEDTNAPLVFSNWIATFPGIPTSQRNPVDDPDGERGSRL
jgi:hypothetical protein